MLTPVDASAVEPRFGQFASRARSQLPLGTGLLFPAMSVQLVVGFWFLIVGCGRKQKTPLSLWKAGFTFRMVESNLTCFT